MFISFFLNFNFLDPWRGKRAKNGPEWQKIVWCAPYLRNHTSSLSFMVQVYKMIISPCVFFNVKILIFQVFKRLKGKKMVQNDKHFCLSHLTFQKLLWYDLHLWYTCMYRRKKPPGVFSFFFKILIFKIFKGMGVVRL